MVASQEDVIGSPTQPAVGVIGLTFATTFLILRLQVFSQALCLNAVLGNLTSHWGLYA